MWLLNTSTLKLQYFHSPNDKRLSKNGGYAILSHVWQQGKEQSFQDVQALQLESHPTTSPFSTPLSRASPKIRNCCVLAQSHGYRWVWIDTCCIDKTSSAELSEAINSMYAWYAQAAVCYAYLRDVDGDDLQLGSAFYNSRWFRRGWTLQELLAPTSLLFVLEDWNILGTRTDLVEHLEKITKIDVDVLLCRRRLRTVSIAERMSWASRRKTTRVEDEAYCLMGIFGINMPTIYGEGRAAFYRLQEELMKVSPDQTIFAWGKHIDFPRFSRTIIDKLKGPVDPEDDGWRHWCLFASSPRDFRHTLKGRYKPEPMPLADVMRSIIEQGQLRAETISSPEFDTTSMKRPATTEFTVTSHGMRSNLPIIWLRDLNFCIAVLGCRDACTGAVIGLLLCLSPLQQLEYQGDYRIYMSGTNPTGPEMVAYRLVMLSTVVEEPDNIMGNDLGPTAAIRTPQSDLYCREINWDTIHIMHRPPAQPQNRFGVERTQKLGILLAEIKLSQWSLSELQKWGFRRRQSLSMMHHSHDYRVDRFSADPAQDEEFVIIIGECFCPLSEAGELDDDGGWDTDSDSDSENLLHVYRTAIVSFTSTSALTSDLYGDSLRQHVDAVMASADCSLGHMQEQQNWTLKYGDEDRAVQLTGSTLLEWDKSAGEWDQAESFLAIDIRISGRVYTSLRERARSLDLVKALFSRGYMRSLAQQQPHIDDPTRGRPTPDDHSDMQSVHDTSDDSESDRSSESSSSASSGLNDDRSEFDSIGDSHDNGSDEEYADSSDSDSNEPYAYKYPAAPPPSPASSHSTAEFAITPS